MTNEEKAVELGIKYQTPCHGIGDCEFEAKQSAIEMAQWKDVQYSEWIADIVGCPPCELSNIDDEVCLNTDCETYCGTEGCNDARCWQRYFEYKMRKSND